MGGPSPSIVLSKFSTKYQFWIGQGQSRAGPRLMRALGSSSGWAMRFLGLLGYAPLVESRGKRLS